MAPPLAAKNFHQHQPITTAIRTICDSYPPDTCLRELLQNADDAEATEIEYVLDTNSYLDSPLLNDGLKEYHGPALLARNNSVFSDADFASLSSIGDSRKRYEASSTGKFGQGFNAVYHWTDGPWVYSRNWLLILDPHERWSVKFGQPGGPTWDVVKEGGYKEIQNHLKTFRAFHLDVSQEINETIIRIPLRTKAQAMTSKIVEREITIEEIKGALDQFGREVREGGLLFLKHIQKVTVRINADVVWEANLLLNCPSSVKARQEIPSDFKELFSPVAEKGTKSYLSKALNIDVEFTTKGVPTLYRYIVHHTMRGSSGHKELDQWARERKLFPWVAVAAPIEHHENFVGRLFSTLRLPILTNQPVHLHGLFSITPDRGRLTSSGKSSGSEDFTSKWNKFLFTSCIAPAWADLLLDRSPGHWHEDGFNLWPRVTDISMDQWNRLDDDVIDVIMKKELPVWPTAKKCVSAHEGFFSIKNPETTKYTMALTEANVAVVQLGMPLFERLQQRYPGSVQITRMTPKTVRQYLRSHKAPTLPKIPRTLSKLLLEYCLLDVQQTTDDGSKKMLYNEFDGITIWPTLNGQLSAFGELDLLLPRDLEETELFANARKARTLDLNDLTDQTLNLLRKDIAFALADVRYRRLADLSEDWPTIYPLAEPSDTSMSWTLRPMGHGELTIDRIWTWICARLEEEKQMPPQLDDLWLLPTNSRRLRRYAPGPKSKPMLIITECEPLFEFAIDLVLRDPDVAPPVLHTELLPAVAVRLLQRNARSIPKLHGACIDHFESLLAWLVAGKELLQTASEEQKRTVLQHLEALTRYKDQITNDERNIAGQLRSLPIFSKVSSSFPFKERSITTCDLQYSTDGGITHRNDMPGSSHVFKAPVDLPPIPNISGVLLFDLSNRSERHLVKRFNLIEEISLLDLLQHYLLPWAVAVQNGPLITAKEALIEFTFKHATKQWVIDISKIPIIPLPLSGDHERKYRCLSGMIDPTSQLSDLYFRHEDVFPCSEFFQRHKEALRACGIVSELSWSTPLDRVQYYSTCRAEVANLEVKVKRLLQLPIHEKLSSSESSIADIRTLKWLPASPASRSTMALLSSRECRGFDESDLVDHVLGKTHLLVNKEWKQILGWEKRIELDVLLRQMDYCLADNDHDKVDHVLDYLQSHFDPAECAVLKSKPCVFGVRKTYLIPKETFVASELLARYPMAPYLDEIDSHFATKHLKLLSHLGVRKEPSIQDMLDVQTLLSIRSKGPLKGSNLNVVISSLEIAAQLLGDQENADVLIPDTESILRAFPDVVYGDPNITGKIAEFSFAHPAISVDLAQRLGIEHSLTRATRLEIESEDEDEDEYTPRERLSTVISDTLGRYPIDSTFNEFLANADDCHATAISWILDECENGPHESLALLTSELKPLQGPALFAHNDQVFTEKDFAGFKEIGQGGKSDDVTTSGMFGRGALTMYHYTDAPTIVSGGFILILDPQQELLPKNKHRKRKAGVKLPLRKAHRLCPDQLAPFHGLCHFSKDLDYYKGTLFRLPFRVSGKKTTLTDSVVPVGSKATKTLLEDYFSSARKSLLFLHNVKSIAFNIRGQTQCIWSVSVARSGESEDDIFRRLKLSVTQHNRKPSEEIWRVGITDIVESPVVHPGRGSHKITECGVAACVSHLGIDQRVFCKLPTHYGSRLPISFHASFAITGDRRTIPWEIQQGDATIAKWNYWLLTSCIPDFYLDFLKDLALNQGMDTFNFWPSTSGSSSSPLSGLVAKSFWEKIMDDQHIAYELYPKIVSEPFLHGSTPMIKRAGGKSRKPHAVTSLKYAEFDFLPEQTSKKLRPLLIKLCPNLVRPPSKIWPNLKSAEVTQHTVVLTPAFFCGLFGQEHNCRLLEEFLDALGVGEGFESKSEALEKILEVVVPKAISSTDGSSLDILDGCRILPKLDGSLGRLTLKMKADAWSFMATEEEQRLLYFASHLMVNTKLFQRSTTTTSSKLTDNGEVMSIPKNPIDDILKASFNVRSLEIEDLGMMLAQPQSPINASAVPESRDGWIIKFWAYVNTRFRVPSNPRESDEPKATFTELLTKCGLQDHPVYRFKIEEKWRYITPRQFDEGAYLVRPNKKQQILLCQEIGGLNIVDPAAVPFLLAAAECDLTMRPAFERLLRVLSQIVEEKQVPIQDHLSEILSEASILSLQSVLLKYLRSNLAINFKTVLQRLPVWLSFQPSQLTKTSKYIPAEGAVFCKTSKLLLPWVVRSLGNLISPAIVDRSSKELKSLGVYVVPPAEIWKRTQQYQPETLMNIPGSDYSAFVQELANNKIKPKTAIAPNGWGILCKASSLYDHKDEIFTSAFSTEYQTRFLHVEMQDCSALHDYWISLGLRSRGPTKVFNPEDYVQCAIAIQARWQPTEPCQPQTFCQDARKVAAYLHWDTPSLRKWPGSSWGEIAKVRMFRVDDDFSKQPLYRRSRMSEKALKHDHCSLLGIGIKQDVRIIWSQLPFLNHEPVEFVFGCIPGHCRPTAITVFEHLKYMVSQCNQMSNKDLTEYVKDIQASYTYLQENSESAGRVSDIQETKIFFNIDATELDGISATDLEQSLTSAKFLCLNSPVDAGIIKVSRKFLVPYEKLLKSLGCKSIVQPQNRAPRPSSDQTSPLITAMTRILSLRDQRQLIDVVFEAEGCEKPAHRIFLAAVSEYCRAQFSGEWGLVLSRQAKIQIPDMTFATLSQMVDFAYTSKIDWPKVQDPGNNDEIAKALDELLDLLQATDMWLLGRLHTMTENEVIDNAKIYIRPDNVESVREIAKDANALGLVGHCDTFIKDNASFVAAMRDAEGGVKV